MRNHAKTMPLQLAILFFITRFTEYSLLGIEAFKNLHTALG